MRETEHTQKEILRTALNIARIEKLGFWINDEGMKVMGDRENQKEIQEYKLKRLSHDWLGELTETELDPKFIATQTAPGAKGE